MLKRFHWGHAITLFYIVFVGAVITVLVASFGVDHTLVVDDYYAQDIAYQSRYEKASNSLQSDALKINYVTSSQELRLQFTDAEVVSGSIQFYRPSDKSQDFIQEITSTNRVISTRDLMRGKWKVKVDWTQGGVAYYQEETIYL